jgi:hypothetical protein
LARNPAVAATTLVPPPKQTFGLLPLSALEGLARERACRGRQRHRNTFLCAPMPVLCRPHDHRRDIRRSAPSALHRRGAGSGSTPHDNRRGASRLATPFLYLSQAARRNIRALSSPARQSFSKRRAHVRPSQDPPPTHRAEVPLTPR